MNEINKPAMMNEISSNKINDRIPNKNKSAKSKALVAAATLLTITTAAGVLSKQSHKQSLEKAGLIAKDGCICVKETGAKFTGSVKRNVSAFGLKKEITNFEDGMLKEILNYGFKGKELDGYFYKNGKLLYSSGTPTGNSKIKYYPYYKYNNGQIILYGDSKLEPKESVFERMRERMKKEG